MHHHTVRAHPRRTRAGTVRVETHSRRNRAARSTRVPRLSAQAEIAQTSQILRETLPDTPAGHVLDVRKMAPMLQRWIPQLVAVGANVAHNTVLLAYPPEQDNTFIVVRKGSVKIGRGGFDTPLVPNRNRANAAPRTQTRTAEGMTYEQALKRSHGRVKHCTGLEELAVVVSVRAMEHPGLSPRMVYDGAVRRGVTALEIGRMNGRQLDDLMWVE